MHIEHSDFHDQLVRGLTHKMNNILSLFHGYVGVLLEDETLSPQAREGLNRIQEGAEEATELIERTNSLARPSSLVWREIDVLEFLNDSKELFHAVLPPGIQLTIEVPADLPKISADVARLRAILAEIIRNAGEASQPGSEVHVSAKADVAAPTAYTSSAAQTIRWMNFHILDSGHGIAPELSKKVFQPFFTTRQGQSHNGLGLSVALGLTQQLGGLIRFSSKPGRTAFQVLIPCRV